MKQIKIAMMMVAMACGVRAAEPVSFSGIYPSLAYFNNEGECGTGAVVPWAGRLWVITYAPHMPKGSSDKLYEITPELTQVVRPESIGGTPANRMIHSESGQLFIGPYAIDTNGGVRTITYSSMYGRHTGNARHLTDPTNKIYYATMEEGIYEVDVKTLAPTYLWLDEQLKKGGEWKKAESESREGRFADFPGYHGKGFYSGQGVMVYANNGEHGGEAQKNPNVPSGILAEWDGKAAKWTIVRRNQFTDVTGPGGILGNPNPATDPIWAIGWDHRSLILALRDGGTWSFHRLPKASHSYDGAHGWNTEWPRIRDIGPEGSPDLMMTMHGMFWKFPQTFSRANAAGIRPRSAYLKVVGDFCRWNDRLVLGCDDSAKSEFLNKRKVKGGIQGPGQSQSNLQFVDLAAPDQLGPTTAEGAVWVKDAVKAGEASDPFLGAGWEHRGVHFVNGGASRVIFALEGDDKGDGTWRTLREVEVEAGEGKWVDLSPDGEIEWVRARAQQDCAEATVHFAYSAKDKRSTEPDAMFAGLSKIGDAKSSAGLVRARGEDKRTLAFVASDVKDGVAKEVGYYELDADAKLKRVDDAKAAEFTAKGAAIPTNVITVDDASVLITDDRGRRWRLPKGDAKFDAAHNNGQLRICREVATERDLMNCHGTFYELPAENADGFAKIRPVSSHGLAIMDYCSYRGLMILTGITDAGAKNPHIIRSDDGKAALWAGAIDDLWKLGKPVGHGGPWKNSAVKKEVPSDAYLFGFYDKRTITLSHDAKEPVVITIELDAGGQGIWAAYERITVKPGEKSSLTFPDGINARWLRVTSSADCNATAQLAYE